jgi:hypothetical protein
VIAAGIRVDSRSVAEFTSDDHQRIIEQPTFSEILNQDANSAVMAGSLSFRAGSMLP